MPTTQISHKEIFSILPESTLLFLSPGEGTLLFGDKTALSRPSAFDRINVRRLFLVLEKAIATAAKFQLFEFNDEFTRAQFKNLVEPFLRDVQGRRGITDFSVVCDESNNTGEVIDRNEFVGDIFIKPARSINFITLNFIAVRTGVEFSEVGGLIMATIDPIQSKYRGGGAKDNQFRVILNTPSGIATGLNAATAQFMIRSRPYYDQTLGEIPIQFRGRQLYLAGDREFELWTTTVLNDTDFAIRNGIERWMNGINDLQTNTGVSNVTEYTADMVVQQLDRDNRVLKQYTLTSCFPQAISAIDLNMDTVNEVETFEITWRYTSFNVGV